MQDRKHGKSAGFINKTGFSELLMPCFTPSCSRTMSMRIREDGKHAHRTDTIEMAADFWDCNKTTALMKSADFSHRIDNRIQKVLSRGDLTARQKQEIAETLTIPGTYELAVNCSVQIEK